ncbi:MAG: hypothetical protein ACRDKG_10300, partial [Actinomycetota bacterium]
YRAFLHGTSRPGDLVIDADDVIAATGFSTPLRDLPQLGVATFYQGRLPAQTPWWESTSTPGVFFAGSITQGSIGLKKYGIPSNSAAVHGFRYNARVLARRIAETRLGVQVDRPAIAPNDVVGFLLAEATYAPELWNQQSYLAHALLFDPDRGIVDEGIIPLAYFVDDAGGDAVAIAVETDAEGDIHPAVYVRRDGRVDEHTLASSPLMKFDGQEQQRQLAAVLKGLV